MGIFNTKRKQYEALTAAWKGRWTMPLKEAAEHMKIPVHKVEQRIREMEAAGFFNEETPAADLTFDLLIRNRNLMDFSLCMGLTEALLSEIQKAETFLSKYDAFRSSDMRSQNIHQIGHAFRNFAEGALKGKKFTQNLKETAQDYLEERPQSATPDFDGLLSRMGKQLRAFRSFAREHTDYLYPQKLHCYLKDLLDTLKEWEKSVHKAMLPQDWNEVCRISEHLVDAFSEFKAMSALVKSKPEGLSQATALQAEIRRYIAYLEQIKDEIRDYRTRAAVLRLSALLHELDMAYGKADENFSRSDAKSLRNIYLPTMKSLLEKYRNYEQLQNGKNSGNYQPEETIGVLEDELPRALLSIRNSLQMKHTSAMEDEATALRKKLEMDGLL